MDTKSSLSHLSHALGNTNPTPVKPRRLCFTLNNWKIEELSQMYEYFDKVAKGYVMGKEICPDTGTPHIQGYVEFIKQIRFTTLKKKMPRVHWEVTKGNRDQNITYCTKNLDGLGYVCTWPIPKTWQEILLEEEYTDVEWHPWQQDIIDIVESKPDKRTIHWYWEGKGNVGKSFVAKYLWLKYDCIIATGKAGDVFNQVLMWMQRVNKTKKIRDWKKSPKLVIVDIPRSSLGYLNYGALEQLKNGMMYSGKYEGGVVALKPPHVICFANDVPDMSEMSRDRFNCVHL